VANRQEGARRDRERQILERVSGDAATGVRDRDPTDRYGADAFPGGLAIALKADDIDLVAVAD
jgi:hypothetical protein